MKTGNNFLSDDLLNIKVILAKELLGLLINLNACKVIVSLVYKKTKIMPLSQ